MKMISKLDKWHRTQSGYLVFGVVELAITYGLISLAIDRGTVWWYLFAIIFFIGAIQNLFKLIGTFIHGRH